MWQRPLRDGHHSNESASTLTRSVTAQPSICCVQVDLSTIAHWMGHVSVNTTNKYISIDLEAKREALAKAKPLLNGRRRSTKWHQDRDLVAWLTSL